MVKSLIFNDIVKYANLVHENFLDFFLVLQQQQLISIEQ
jgi:hypothetical protein